MDWRDEHQIGGGSIDGRAIAFVLLLITAAVFGFYVAHVRGSI